MLLAGVAGHKVEQNVHPAGVRLTEQLLQVLVRAVAGRDLAVIPYIIARVLHGRIKAGVQPNRVAAKGLYIVQLCDHAL